MNKKGQVALFGVMVAVFLFFAAVALIPAIKDNIVIARDATHLDCDNTSISTGQKATCLIVDLYLPYYIGVAIAVGFGIMFARRLSSG